MINKIFFISWQQFGYHTDMLNYCKYLKEKANISFLSFDENLPKYEEEGINIIYVPRVKSRIINRILLYLYIFYYIIKIKPNITLIKYFRGCSLVKRVLFNRKIIMDIRTVTVCQDNKERIKRDSIINKESKVFDNVTVISEHVANKLNLCPGSYHILPLGGKTMIKTEDEELFNDKLSLIYVGVFDERNVQDTIIAFNKLSEKYNGTSMNYIIIGFANNYKEELEIKNLIKQNKYNNIKFIGRVPNEQLGSYFERSNVGISYIPKTEYFNFQPPTKTYEYLFNGLYTIATSTFENKKIITNNSNGNLINDNSDELFECLDKLYQSYKDIKVTKKDIIESVKEHSWKNICEDLYQHLDTLIKNN